MSEALVIGIWVLVAAVIVTGKRVLAVLRELTVEVRMQNNQRAAERAVARVSGFSSPRRK